MRDQPQKKLPPDEIAKLSDLKHRLERLKQMLVLIAMDIGLPITGRSDHPIFDAEMVQEVVGAALRNEPDGARLLQQIDDYRASAFAAVHALQKD